MTHQIDPRLLTSLLLLVCAPTGARAQGLYPAAPAPSMEIAAPGAGSFGHSALVHFDAGELADLALLRGGTLHLVTAAGLAPFAVSATGTYGSFDVLHEAGAGGADALVASGDDGTWFLTWNESTLGIDRAPILVHPAWLDCGEVRVRRTGGPSQLALLSSDARTVGFIQAPSWQPQAGGITALAATVLDMECFDFNADGVDEVALLGTTTLEIWRHDGSSWVLATSWSQPTAQGRVLVRGRSAGRGWLGWLTDVAGGQVVTIVMNGEVYGSFALGDRDIRALATGSWNTDDHRDLIAGWGAGREFGVFQDSQVRQQLFSPQFSDISSVVWSGGCAPELDLLIVPSSSPNLPAPTTAAVPAAGDVDGDGDDDVAYAIEDDGTLLLAMNGCTDHEEMKPRLDQEDAVTAPVVQLAEVGQELHLQFEIQPTFLPASANGLEVLLFRREVDVPGDDAHDTSPLSVASNLFVLAGGPPPARLPVDLVLAAPNGDPVDPGDLTLDDDMFFWVQRFVTVNTTTNAVKKVFPAEVGGIQASCDWGLAGCSSGAAQQGRMLGWGGTGAIDVEHATNDGVVIGNGLAFPCVPDLSGPMRRTGSNFVLWSGM